MNLVVLILMNGVFVRCVRWWVILVLLMLVGLIMRMFFGVILVCSLVGSCMCC